jgi:predicted nucleic acid-binding protein
MNNKVLIDTSIFVNAYYLTNKQKQQKAIDVLKKFANTSNAHTSIQNIIEFSNFVLNKAKTNKKDLESEINQIKTLFNIITYSENTITHTINLVFTKKTSFFDALLIQTMIENNIKIIYTENDKIFKKVKGIKAINPFK